ncbi:MAG: cation-translocating P-type ATPase [Planctomycetota bacterium]|nr:cation-translocating P-type ATPase [Planctomycetota bacterium]
MRRYSCVHCGLPVRGVEGLDPEAVYCCYGCRLAARIVGGREGSGHAWTLLRLGVGAFLAMNVMMISLLLYTHSPEKQAVPFFRWAMLALATPAMAILGYPFLTGAWQELRRRRLSLDALIAVGSFAAFAVSAVNTARGVGHVYYDTATMLPLLVTFGKLLEAAAKSRTGRLVHGLETLLPDRATRLGEAGPEAVSLDALRAGDLLRVLPGQRLPADGVIVEGVTTIESAAFTGESRPRVHSPGDAVIAGTVNGEGPLVVRAAAVGADLLLRRIIDMVEQARTEPSRAERIAHRAAAVFTPAVLALAALSAAAWGFAGDARQACFVALSVLVVACPCAMGIAAPLATALAVGAAARRGALVRGGDLLERLGGLPTIFFDKTGPLTEGAAQVTAVETFDPSIDDRELLTWPAGLESASGHSLARAIRAEAAARGLPAGSVHDVTIAPGEGLTGTVTIAGESRRVFAGSGRYVESLVAAPPAAGDPPAQATQVFVGWDGLLRGRVLLADAVRPDAARAVEQLQRMGVECVLLTGDEEPCARAVADAVGIARVLARCRPDEKMRHIASAAGAGGTVGFVGDGVNDAPALAAAGVGIALGAGSDLARQAGGVLLISNDLLHVPWLISLSRRTGRLIRGNLAWAFFYNALALAAAAAGVLHPLLAALAMVVSSLTVLANSLRLVGGSSGR